MHAAPGAGVRPRALTPTRNSCQAWARLLWPTPPQPQRGDLGPSGRWAVGPSGRRPVGPSARRPATEFVSGCVGMRRDARRMAGSVCDPFVVLCFEDRRGWLRLGWELLCEDKTMKLLHLAGGTSPSLRLNLPFPFKPNSLGIIRSFSFAMCLAS